MTFMNIDMFQCFMVTVHTLKMATKHRSQSGNNIFIMTLAQLLLKKKVFYWTIQILNLFSLDFIHNLIVDYGTLADGADQGQGAWRLVIYRFLQQFKLKLGHGA